ncbi:DUF1499 domain-containing protein [Ilumatobacter coccineus]|uniref:DUF1499 domain-containing protein n=1 Tax=Ilumatobacter coccineus (strain NBRC 103263 / KCTC 29153 / YM16-304) TaxID=1313172 RepID=A0A6C7EB77_ILUCY|nr:DUF1499 domain-containing protein [Ilumatobacter coccineus]BAN03997.1 hypothetical protein YM304_36830 [Ilumatobacter coccineus YM16-304]
MLLVVAIVLAVIVVVIVGAMIGVRRADDVVAEWHADPLTAAKPSTPNSYRVAPLSAPAGADVEAPVFSVPVGDLAAAFDAVALGDGRVEVLAGSAADGHVTYVQRSALFAFPDYVSVRFLDAEHGGSTLAVFSRSRFGQSDLGVNKKRVLRWLEGVSSRVG